MLKQLNESMKAVKFYYHQYCQQNYDISGDNEFTPSTDFIMGEKA